MGDLTMNKATVFQIGNRLAKTMPRKDAFIQAWQIVRRGAVSFPVRGVMVGSRQEALRRLPQYEPAQVRAFLMPEPENSADKNAIAVMVGVQYGKGYYKLGYIPASETAKVAAIRGKVSIRVVSGTWGFSGRTTFGGRVTLAV
jgi:hypothetical protein